MDGNQRTLAVGQVFVPGGMPTFTYFDRRRLGLEDRIRNYLTTRYKILSISGPTKTGKTVLLKSVLDDPVWLAGGEIATLNDFWEQIGDQLGVYPEESVTESTGDETQRSADGTLNLGVAKGAYSGTESTTSTTGSSRLRRRPVGSATRAALGTNLRPLVIDDFHYIESEVQVGIVRGLKNLVFDGLAVIIASVPHRAHDVVRVEKEMTGRVEQLPIDFWSESELMQIALRGFDTLGAVDQDNGIASHLASESFSSPHLMQEFCLEVCIGNGITHSVRPQSVKLGAPDWDQFFARRASASSRTAFDILAKGPRQRTDRKARRLADGGTTDIYGVVLAAIAATGPLTHLTLEDLRDSIRDVLDEDPPQRHEITRVLEEMTKIARRQLSGEPVLDYDMELSTLFIADPFFAYFLRWGIR